MPDNMNVERGLLGAVALVSLGVLGAVTARSGKTLMPESALIPESRAPKWTAPESRATHARTRQWLPARIARRRRRQMAGVEPIARAAQRLNVGSALLGLSVLADSSIEHYRGMFHNKGMLAPLLASAATIATSLHGAHDATPRA
jgi:hypothetical protein